MAASAAIAGDGADVPAEKKGFLGIEAFTWQKIIPLGFMFFCILFNYTILRDTKVRRLSIFRTRPGHSDSFVTELLLFDLLYHGCS